MHDTVLGMWWCVNTMLDHVVKSSSPLEIFQLTEAQLIFQVKSGRQHLMFISLGQCFCYLTNFITCYGWHDFLLILFICHHLINVIDWFALPTITCLDNISSVQQLIIYAGHEQLRYVLLQCSRNLTTSTEMYPQDTIGINLTWHSFCGKEYIFRFPIIHHVGINWFELLFCQYYQHVSF